MCRNARLSRQEAGASAETGQESGSRAAVPASVLPGLTTPTPLSRRCRRRRRSRLLNRCSQDRSRCGRSQTYTTKPIKMTSSSMRRSCMSKAYSAQVGKTLRLYSTSSARPQRVRVERSGTRRARCAPPERVNPPPIGAGILGRCPRTFLTARDPGRRARATSDAAPSQFPPPGRSGLDVASRRGLATWGRGNDGGEGKDRLGVKLGRFRCACCGPAGVRRVRVGAG